MLNNTSDENNVTPESVNTPVAPLSIDKIAEITGKEKWELELDNLVQKFNKEYAVVLNSNKALVMKTSFDLLEDGRQHKERLYLPTQTFHTLYANTVIQVGTKDVGNNVEVPVYATHSQAWFKNKHRYQYIDGIVFMPFQYVNGIEKRPQISFKKLNLWEGYSVKAVKGERGALERIYYHIEHIICNDDPACIEYLLNWIARGFQYPEKTGQVATILRGLKGCGKGTIAILIKFIFGQHSLHITNAQHLVGNFNGHLSDCCFLFADEAFFAGDKQHENIQKALITEPTLMVERKGIDAIEMPNRLKILMASNNDWVAPASKDERRYFVLDVSSEKIGDTEYFNALHKDISNPDIQAAFLFDMLNRDISNFTVGKVPDTKALQHQRLQSLDSFGCYWHDVLQRGFVYQSQHGNDLLNYWNNEIAVELVHRGYEQWFNKNKVGQFGIVPREKVGRHLTSWYGEKKRKLSAVGFAIGETVKGEIDISKKQTYVYTVGSYDEAITSFCNAEKVDSTQLLKSANLHTY